MNIKKAIPAIIFATILPVTSTFADTAKFEDQATFKQATQDAWLKGKIETALLLNTHLNSFKIDTAVENDVVLLSGEVSDDVHRDLAREIALGINGVERVIIEIEVIDAADAKTSEEGRKFKQKFDDMTTTASVKSKLIANNNVSAHDINVDTMNGVVTLTGEVSSAEEEALAIKIAENVDDVVEVTDKLTVISS